MCWYAVWIEGNVTEILENERINTAAGQGARVIEDPIDDGVEAKRIPREPGSAGICNMPIAGLLLVLSASHRRIFTRSVEHKSTTARSVISRAGTTH